MRRVLFQILAYGCLTASLVVPVQGRVVAQPATPATNAALAANEALVNRYHELFNAGAFDQFAEVLAPDFVVHTAPPGEDPGIAGLVAGLSEVRVGLPDITITVDDLVAEGTRSSPGRRFAAPTAAISSACRRPARRSRPRRSTSGTVRTGS